MSGCCNANQRYVAPEFEIPQQQSIRLKYKRERPLEMIDKEDLKMELPPDLYKIVASIENRYKHPEVDLELHITYGGKPKSKPIYEELKIVKEIDVPKESQNTVPTSNQAYSKPVTNEAASESDSFSRQNVVATEKKSSNIIPSQVLEKVSTNILLQPVIQNVQMDSDDQPAPLTSPPQPLRAEAKVLQNNPSPDIVYTALESGSKLPVIEDALDDYYRLYSHDLPEHLQEIPEIRPKVSAKIARLFADRKDDISIEFEENGKISRNLSRVSTMRDDDVIHVNAMKSMDILQKRKYNSRPVTPLMRGSISTITYATEKSTRAPSSSGYGQRMTDEQQRKLQTMRLAMMTTGVQKQQKTPTLKINLNAFSKDFQKKKPDAVQTKQSKRIAKVFSVNLDE